MPDPEQKKSGQGHSTILFYHTDVPSSIRSSSKDSTVSLRILRIEIDRPLSIIIIRKGDTDVQVINPSHIVSDEEN